MIKALHIGLQLLPLTILLGRTSIAIGQVGTLTTPRLSFEILDVPAGLNTEGTPFLIFYPSDSCGCEVMALGRASTDEEFIVVQDLYGDVWYNEAKALGEMRFEGDTLMVASELPFKSTVVSYPIVVEAGKMSVLEEIWYDPNDAVLAEMEACLERADVVCALENYYAVQYPMSYVDYREFGDRVVEIAYPRAQDAAAKGYPADAVAEMREWAEVFGIGVIEDYLPDRLSRKMEPREQFALRAVLDFVGYELAAGDTATTISRCATLIGYELDLPEPHRLLGDIHFERGNYAAGKPEYLEFMKAMKRNGRAREIPSYVKKRSKYKTE